MEQNLGLLADDGELCFICSDRWTKNKYGGPLRQLVASKYRLAVYVDMVGTPAFNADVIAYPAITVISRDRRSTATRVLHRPDIDAESLSRLALSLRGADDGADDADHIVRGSEPWLLDKETARTGLVEYPRLRAISKNTRGRPREERRQKDSRRLVSDRRPHLPRSGAAAQTPRPRHQGRGAGGLRGGLVLSPP
jgi:hypothetical protein